MRDKPNCCEARARCTSSAGIMKRPRRREVSGPACCWPCKLVRVTHGRRPEPEWRPAAFLSAQRNVGHKANTDKVIRSAAPYSKSEIDRSVRTTPDRSPG